MSSEGALDTVAASQAKGLWGEKRQGWQPIRRPEGSECERLSVRPTCFFGCGEKALANFRNVEGEGGKGRNEGPGAAVI